MLRFTRPVVLAGCVLFIIAFLNNPQAVAAVEQSGARLLGFTWTALPPDALRPLSHVYEVEIKRDKSETTPNPANFAPKPTPTTISIPKSPVAATPKPAATATPLPSKPVSQSALAKEELELLALINLYRQTNKLPTVVINNTLTNAARWMSFDMASKHYLDHTDSLGRTAFKRIAAFGYPSDTHRGENIGAGYETAAEVMEGWKKSPAHLANLLNPNYRVVGISRIYDPTAPYKWYWTTDYGSR